MGLCLPSWKVFLSSRHLLGGTLASCSSRKRNRNGYLELLLFLEGLFLDAFFFFTCRICWFVVMLVCRRHVFLDMHWLCFVYMIFICGWGCCRGCFYLKQSHFTFKINSTLIFQYNSFVDLYYCNYKIPVFSLIFWLIFLPVLVRVLVCCRGHPNTHNMCRHIYSTRKYILYLVM